MICPRCNANLVLSNTQGIEIDYCPNCRGVWLDRGELEKIIERSTQYSAPYSEHGYSEHGDHYEHHDRHHDRYRHDDHHEYDQHSRHKKGFFSDLFDF
mgnify:CR=1 FL=1